MIRFGTDFSSDPDPMAKDAIPYISADAVRSACSMPQVIEAMRTAFRDLSTRDAAAPLRTRIPLAAGGDALFMPAHSGRLGRHTVKVASVHPENPAEGLPRVQATVIHFDSKTGRAMAILEGRSVTAIRTGAGSGLATDLLARPDASVAVIVGSGVQAETQLEAVCCVRPIREAYCLSPTPDHAARFAERMSERLHIEVLVGDRSVLKRADVVCTATTSTTPVLYLEDVKPGVHVNAVGTHRPDAAELGAGLVVAARLFVDQREACLAEAGDILIPIRTERISESHIIAGLGELVVGRIEGRVSATDITVFKSVGNAIQDLYLADLIVNNIKTK